MNIYSRIEPTTILHIIQRKRDIQQGRTDLVEPDQFIQCAAIRQNKGVTYRPHRHIEKHEDLMDITGQTTITQESWVVISGLVKIILYDLDDTIIHEDVLESGDVSITLEGGHNYEFLQDNSLVYEFKTGPYEGVENDKVFI